MYHVISCGVNTPPNETPLRFAEKDASDIATVFSSAIGPVSGVTPLLGIDADNNGIFSAFLAAAESPPEYLVFYFSGHGNDEGIALADGDLTYETLAAYIRYVEAPYTFVILDVCSAASAAPFLKEAVVGGLGTLKESWLAALASATPGTRLIFSTGANKSALEPVNLGNGLFTHFFLKALRESSGDLSWNNESWISDRRACVTARWHMKVSGHAQIPLFFNLSGDFPLTISQDDNPVGFAHFSGTAISRHSLDVSFRIASREGLKTTLRWELANGRGDVVASGRYTKTPMIDAAKYSGSIPCPHEKLRTDSFTRASNMISGLAPVTWTLQLFDEADNLLDSSEVRATYKMSKLHYLKR